MEIVPLLQSIKKCAIKTKNIQAKGTLELKLSDFELEPPKKMLGMIKVDNEIKVNLAIRMSEI